jgi:hypothetical protein
MWRLLRDKRLFISESDVDLNWCTPCREKPDQYVIRFPRSIRIWPSTICISRGPRIITFHESPIDLDGSHCSWEKGFPTQFTACRLTDPRVRTQFLSQVNQWTSRFKPSFCQWQAIRLTRPIYQHAIGTFNTYSQGPTYRSLTNTCGATVLKVSTFHIPLLDLSNQ